MARVERVADTTAHTGEGPLWHPDEGRLYWVDIPAGRLHRYDPETERDEVAYETDGVPIGGFTVEADGALLLFTRGRVERLVPGESTTERVATVDADTRFNDVIADPEGRVFAGTMPGSGALGDLYRIDTDGSVRVVVEGIDVPNGMGFSGDGTTFYLTESASRRIDAFDYDYATGEIANRRSFVETPPGDGVPDGMTVDAADHLWSARWDGGRVVRYDPSGAVVDAVSLPARKVASVTFGEPSRDALYLTTALAGRDRSVEGDGAGALFRVTGLAPSGRSEFRSRVAVG
ncbi:SMP-30/gluconolactonase/LRE family protein [Halorubrum sp. CBA1125]|uniref:SMP-30/gluconolactonase/LRE family protein n=1 Tax=Halorubrum sp. CBA1125 TaxID=2668072 RepID=UPI0012E8C9D7|nr:SMP-30/gluconolactonase/LRE family protein [Halorubrum sp. CBA1125]MUW15917.1 SMP-30/gluconolactonase/LRE family protein [Halorubrum sp. CBA1125]